MLFLDMRFDDEEMDALYRNYRGSDYVELRDRFEPGYRARNAIYDRGSTYLPIVESFLAADMPPSPRILDWGGDDGRNTPFRSRASVHHVYDISGCVVVEGARSVGAAEAARNDYDLIAYMQVLEHVASPRDCLREISDVMGPETRFYAELPYEEIMRSESEPTRRLVQKRHWHEHINFFTPEALERLFSDCGLSIEKKAVHLINAGGKDGHIFSIVARRNA